MTDLSLLKLIAIITIFLISIAGGTYPFVKRWRGKKVNLPIGQALASGVFLGAGLISMLGRASSDFYHLHYSYPWASVIAGITFLFFLALEHIGRELSEKKGADTGGFAIIAFLMLSVHSLFAGAALGLSSSVGVAIVLLIAILAHKWAASFALALQIVRSQLEKRFGLTLFVVFTIMAPLGVFSGELINDTLGRYPLLVAIFNAIAAGTFIYLGTLHGLARSFMAAKCCKLKNFTYVIVGFAIMAVVAIWA